MATPAQYRGTGKRKTSVARVILRPGDGATWVNGKSLEEYFPRLLHRMLATAPLKTADLEGQYDLRVRVHGGGPSGQAGAIRHGIARALVEVNPELRVPLKRAGFLTRDARQRRAQEGRPAQGAQGAAVQQAVAAPTVARRYFGTDGVRGVVGEFLTPELVERLGRAAALWTGAAKVFVGRDTRASGRRARGGVRARRRSPRAATASSAASCRRRRSRCSRSISASSSPPRTTRPSTTASSSSTSRAVSSPTLGGADRGAARRGAADRPGDGRARRDRDRLVPCAHPRALRVRPDRVCASSSTAPTARTPGSRPRRSSSAAPRCIAIGDEPDGTNINVGCGATDLALLQRTVRRAGLRPRDRLRRRRRPDARRRRAAARSSTATRSSPILALDLGVDLVAVTVMTNLGLPRVDARARDPRRHDRRRRPLRARGARSAKAACSAASSRGTSSACATTSPATGSPPGCCSAARCSGRTLSEAAAVMSRFPQVKENVRVDRRAS